MQFPRLITTATVVPMLGGMLGAKPAMADIAVQVTKQGPTETTMANLDDLHLHIIDQAQEITSFGGDLSKGALGLSAYQGPVHHWLIERGSVPVSADRFLDLVGQSGADPAFLDVVGQRKSTQAMWGGVGLGAAGVGLLGVVVAGLAGSADVSQGLDSTSDPLVYTGLGILGVGAVAGIVALFEWASASPHDPNFPGQPFTLDEAQDAARAYNSQVDKASQPQHPVQPLPAANTAFPPR